MEFPDIIAFNTLKKLGVLLIYALSAAMCCADITLYTLEIPGLHQKDGQGAYDKIINQYPGSKKAFTILLVPPARANTLFKSCNNCCISPTNNNPAFYDFGGHIVQTLAMNTAKIYIFTPRNSPKIKGEVELLSGKRVGIRRGLPYGKKFEATNISPEIVNSLEQNFSKLELGRLDAVVAYAPDAYIMFADKKIEAYPHDKNNPLEIHEDALMCNGVSKNFINSFNAYLEKSKKNGYLKRILGDAYIAP